MIMFKKRSEQGFTLLEVLIAVLVFSFGLLGIAGMMTISVRNNHNGYLRSQANFLAENMLDRMRANPTAVWNGWYNGTAVVTSTECSLTAPCTYQDLADQDISLWAQSLQVALPNGAGNVNCVNNSALPGNIQPADLPSIWFPAPVFDGVCTITVTWDEANRDSAAEQQSMVLVAQP
ncbi:type IV pilus modification protein PilV [Marinicella sediminis]|uniref:Type IV pilus modification protein PilV n=1 Tax=Marinicella sediminis TaxID=1792834 RepID=A0ABV7J8Z3_9GAMM|nr:type IV pilus modification protein PilV [Marinicella sediminis]